MTYRELLLMLVVSTDEELDQTVTLYDGNMEEYYPAIVGIANEEEDRVNPGQLYFLIEEEE